MDIFLFLILITSYYYSNFRICFIVGYGEGSVLKLTEHFHHVLERILDGSRTHLPRKVDLEKKLQDRKRFRKSDLDPALRVYDSSTKSMWPNLASISRTITELKDKVCLVE